MIFCRSPHKVRAKKFAHLLRACFRNILDYEIYPQFSERMAQKETKFGIVA